MIHVLAFLLLARVVGKEPLGEFGLMVTVSSYILLLVQQGFDTFAIREVARDTSRVREYSTAIIGLRLAIACAVFVPAAAYAVITGIDRTINILLLILSLRYFITAWTPQWCFLALEKPRTVAIASILAQAIFLCGVAVLWNPRHIVCAAVAQVAGEGLAAVYLFRSLQRQAGPIKPRLDWNFSLNLIRQSWPISASVICGTLLYSFDVVALGWFSTTAQIGLYLACYRCITVFIPLMTALNSAIFPRFARTYPDARSARRLGVQIALPAVVCTLLLSLTMGWGAGHILRILYGSAFAEGAVILKVLVWILPVQAVRNVLRQIIFAFELQRFDAFAMTIAVCTNIIFDIWLVPDFGALGCAISTVLSELTLLMVTFYMTCRWVPGSTTPSANEKFSTAA